MFGEVSGGVLLDANLECYENATMLVHHIWLTGSGPADRSSNVADVRLPEEFKEHVDSWRTGIPGCLQVQWLNSDASKLVSAYKKSWFFYNKLETPVERADYLRMLILHTFGGVYVDVDMQALDLVLPHLIPERPINLLRSPLFTEMFQSCFMVAHEREHPFWLEVVARIESNVNAISASNPKGGVGTLMANPLTARYTRMAMTVFLTGPATLDKCIADAHVNNTHVSAFGCLSNALYRGPVAVHHEAGSWTWLPAFRRARAKSKALLRFSRFSFVGTVMAMWPTWIVVGAVLVAWVRNGGVVY